MSDSYMLKILEVSGALIRFAPSVCFFGPRAVTEIILALSSEETLGFLLAGLTKVKEAY
jgi:hypothetical protein